MTTMPEPSAGDNERIGVAYLNAVYGFEGSIEDVISSNCSIISVDPADGTERRLDTAAIVANAQLVRRAFSDPNSAVERQEAADDRITYEVRWSAIHSGQLGRYPPTHRRVDARFIETLRFDAGRITSIRTVQPSPTLMQQLDAQTELRTAEQIGDIKLLTEAERRFGKPVAAACLVRAPGLRAAPWLGGFFGALVPGGVAIDMVAGLAAGTALQKGARSKAGHDQITDRMALVLDDEKAVVVEMHPRRMRMRKALFHFSYSNIVRVDAELNAKSVLGMIELSNGRELRLSSPKAGGAERVFIALKERAGVAAARRPLGTEQAPPQHMARQQSPTADGSANDVVETLERLVALRRDGFLTDDEFRSQKARLLGSN